jgi:Caspase domain
MASSRSSTAPEGLSAMPDPTVLRRAVIVGIDEYHDDEIDNLAGAVNDAGDIRYKLAKYGNFTIADNHFLTNEQATSENIRQAISDLLWDETSCEIALFYFAGHGFRDGYRDGYLAPHDMIRTAPMVRGIRMEELRIRLEASQQKKNIIIMLDCCYAGIAISGRGDRSVSDVGDTIADHFGMVQSSGKFIIASSGEAQKSRENSSAKHEFDEQSQGHHPHGEFTYTLLEGLDDRMKNGSVTLDDLRKCLGSSSRFRGDQSGGAAITIAKFPGYPQFINAQEEITKQLNDNKCLCTFVAIAELALHIDNCSRLTEFLKIKAQIDERLKSYLDTVNQWMLKNLIVLSKWAAAEYSRTQNLLSQLNFDALSRLDDFERNLVGATCNLALEDAPPEHLIPLLKCKAQSPPAVPAVQPGTPVILGLIR